MKKIVYLSSLLCILFSSAFSQYPASFQWIPGTPAKEDQIVQGPCNVFASVAAGEAWYYMLYGNNQPMSQQHIYSFCEFVPDGSTTIDYSFNFMKTPGIVASSIISYGESDVVSGAYPYFGDLLKPSNPEPITCVDPKNAGTLYRIGGYTQINLPTIYSSVPSTINRLQRELLNNGPIAINMRTTASSSTQLHCNLTHAYLLFGWVPSGSTVAWLLKDSWPANDPKDPCKYPSNTPSVTDYTGDLLADIINLKTIVNDSADILLPSRNPNGSILNNAVYPATGGGVPESITVTGIDEALTNNNLTISMSLNGNNVPYPINYLSGKAPMTASINATSLSQLDAGYTIQWSLLPAHTGATASVTFGTPTATSTTVIAGVEGYVRIKATITLANGIVEYSTTPAADSFYVCAGIPLKLQENFDACSGNNRSVQWQMVSRSHQILPSDLEITWSPRLTNPLPTVTYQRYDFPNDVINLNWYDLTQGTGYALVPTVTDPGYNNITDGLTQGANESPCGEPDSVTAKLLSGQARDDLGGPNVIRVFPNPVSGRLNVSLPAGKSYTVRLLTIYGSEILSRFANGSFSFDLGRHARGVYIIEFIPEQGKEAPYVQKLILQ